jgi:hypothetical protein
MGRTDFASVSAGILLARAGAADAIDASVVCLAQDGDDILTSDPGDLLDLVRTAGVRVEMIPVKIGVDAAILA